MNITNCQQCGGRVKSVSIGWMCESCQGFIDMRGEFHQHKEEPFMPPMTNADRIRGMSDEELAKEFVLAGEFENRVCFCCKYFKCLQNKDGYCVYKHGRCNMDARLEAYKKWLQKPTEEE